MPLRQFLPPLALVLVLTTISCAHNERPILGKGQKIDEVEFQGVTRFSEQELVDYLRLGESSWLPLLPDYPYDQALFEADLERIETLYDAHGYYDATVVSHKTEIDGDDVRLVIVVAEGQPTKIGRIDVTWVDESSLTEADRAEVEAAALVKEGDVFEVPRLNQSIGSLRQALQLRGYPLAVARGRADVRTDLKEAFVALEIRTGPWAKIGAIEFEGLREVPEYLVAREVEFAVGEPYSPALVKQVEQALNGMRVFRWVSPAPTQQVDDGELTLVMRISEADPQKIRLGLQAGFESTRWQQQVTGHYTHTNLFGHLTRLDLSMVAGWAELPDPFDPFQQGPVVGVAPTFTKKGLLEDHLVWTLGPAWSLDIREGYQFHSPSNRFGVSRWFFGVFNLGVSHNLKFVDFFNLEPRFDEGSSLLGRDFRDPFLLSYVEANASLFFSDSIVEPTNGVVLDGLYDIAGGALQGDYDFHKVEGGVRAYWRPAEWLQMASRARTGLILPYGARGGAPFNLKYYLGGANSVRGWGSDRLSPRLRECDDSGEDCASVPIGGFTMIQGNFELRLRTIGDLWLVGFADMGDVQAETLKYVTEEWNYSAGPGLRVDSPIGLIRLDVGFRLNDPGVYPEEPSWAVYFGLGEAF